MFRKVGNFVDNCVKNICRWNKLALASSMTNERLPLGKTVQIAIRSGVFLNMPIKFYRKHGVKFKIEMEVARVHRAGAISHTRA